MYDIIIIGAGPAGFTAGIYAARREMKTLIIGKEPGGQLMWASEIENYPGFKSIKNFELVAKMQEQVAALGVEIKIDEVKEIEKTDNRKQKTEKSLKSSNDIGDYFIIKTEKEVFEAKTVIIAMGLPPRRLEIPGEKEFNGKGVSYCANCDGPFFKGKTVAVVGGGNAALDAAEVLSKIASRVYLIHRRDEFRGFETIVEEVKSRENIELALNSEVNQILGENKVEKIKVLNKNGEEKELAVDGVFIEVGRIAHTDLVEGLADRDDNAQIKVGKNFETKTPGLFAAGDVVVGGFKQITIACGQGTIAALAAYQYLQLKSGGEKRIILDRG